jgi:hypothetical protein
MLGRHADTTFLGQGCCIDGNVATYELSDKNRLYAKNCNFKRQTSQISVFSVQRGGALALDSCSVDVAEDSPVLDASTCKSFPRLCRYADGTRFSGAANEAGVCICICGLLSACVPFPAICHFGLVSIAGLGQNGYIQTVFSRDANLAVLPLWQ